jgi:hypothetical protein
MTDAPPPYPLRHGRRRPATDGFPKTIPNPRP